MKDLLGVEIGNGLRIQGAVRRGAKITKTLVASHILHISSGRGGTFGDQIGCADSVVEATRAIHT